METLYQLAALGCPQPACSFPQLNEFITADFADQCCSDCATSVAFGPTPIGCFFPSCGWECVTGVITGGGSDGRGFVAAVLPPGTIKGTLVIALGGGVACSWREVLFR